MYLGQDRRESRTAERAQGISTPSCCRPRHRVVVWFDICTLRYHAKVWSGKGWKDECEMYG